MERSVTRRRILRGSIVGSLALLSGCSSTQEQLQTDGSSSQSASGSDATTSQTNPNSGESNSLQDWGTFQANSRRTGNTAAKGPLSKQIGWKKELDANVLLSPAIIDDQVLFATDEKTLQARNRKTGGLLWEKDEENQPIGGVSATSDEVVYVTQSAVKAVGLVDGEEKWTIHVESAPTTGPLLTDQLVLFGAEDTRIYAYTPAGELQWRSVPLRIDQVFPLSADENSVYITADRGLFVHTIAGGQREWSVTNISPGNATTITDQLAIVGSLGGNVYAIHKNGEVEWEYNGTGPIKTSPAVRSGAVYITQSSYLKKLRLSSGDEVWAREVPQSATSSPIVTSDAVYLGSGDTTLAIDPADGSVVWKQSVPGVKEYAPACAAQTLICPGYGSIHAIGPDE